MITFKEEQKNQPQEYDSLSTIKIEIGEKVTIKKIDSEMKEKMEPEDYFYIKDFENKTGIISEENESKSGEHCYRIDFDENHFGYFYSKDFILLE
ncbi:hypothetical protein R4Z09_18105 [Niallia oryzisoli]|uniref:Uncharacterized protein n=1 Tax=Niallia oryzisoli TaxID=1737571 RepID=A0ABZ2C7E9_9BACI